jgi:hypothetical protein
LARLRSDQRLVEAILRPHISKGVTVIVQSTDPLPLTVTEILYDPSVSN